MTWCNIPNFKIIISPSDVLSALTWQLSIWHRKWKGTPFWWYHPPLKDNQLLEYKEWQVALPYMEVWLFVISAYDFQNHQCASCHETAYIKVLKIGWIKRMPVDIPVGRYSLLHGRCDPGASPLTCVLWDLMIWISRITKSRPSYKEGHQTIVL